MRTSKFEKFPCIDTTKIQNSSCAINFFFIKNTFFYFFCFIKLLLLFHYMQRHFYKYELYFATNLIFILRALSDNFETSNVPSNLNTIRHN